jgi:hypothetical protein
MWYAIVDIDANKGLFPKIESQNGKKLAMIGEEIKVRKSIPKCPRA